MRLGTESRCGKPYPRPAVAVQHSVSLGTGSLLRLLHDLNLSLGTGHMACPRVRRRAQPLNTATGVLPARGTYTHTHIYPSVCTGTHSTRPVHIPPVKTVLALGAVQREARWVKLV